jgi:hypothetical protein
VTAGIYLGWHTPELTSAQVRLQGLAVWEIVQYLLNALLFVLIGLQLRSSSTPSAIFCGAVAGLRHCVSTTVIALRLAWVFAVLHAPKWIARRMSNWRERLPPWAGMRGAVSLAAALTTARDRRRSSLSGRADPLPHVLGHPRDARRSGINPPFRHSRPRPEGRRDRRSRRREGAHSQQRQLWRDSRSWSARTGCGRTQRSDAGRVSIPTSRFRARLDDGDDGAIETRSQDYQRLRRELLDAERQALVNLRRSGAITNDVWLRVGRDLDLEDQRLDIWRRPARTVRGCPRACLVRPPASGSFARVEPRLVLESRMRSRALGRLDRHQTVTSREPLGYRGPARFAAMDGAGLVTISLFAEPGAEERDQLAAVCSTSMSELAPPLIHEGDSVMRCSPS